MESSRDFYQKLADFEQAGIPVAVATIVQVRGSAPREVGAKMIIHPLGNHVGTVGGGCGEAEVMRAALDVIELGQPRVLRIDLTQDISMQSLGVCGGITDVYVERWPPMGQDGSFLPELLEALKARRSVALLTVIRAEGPYGAALGKHCLVYQEGAPTGALALGDIEASVLSDAARALAARRSQVFSYAKDRLQVFVEVQRRPPTLLIVGAGHIALPLATLGKLIEFEVAVLDDRPQYANRERFPQADQVVAAPFDRALRNWPIDHDTFIVLVTRGHSHDVECLLQVLDSPARYIGMIGSKRRVRGVFELLVKERGVAPEKLQRVYAPIGLDIEAHTPAEIGVAILAEVIKVYRGGRCPSLSDELRKPQPTEPPQE